MKRFDCKLFYRLASPLFCYLITANANMMDEKINRPLILTATKVIRNSNQNCCMQLENLHVAYLHRILWRKLLTWLWSMRESSKKSFWTFYRRHWISRKTLLLFSRWSWGRIMYGLFMVYCSYVMCPPSDILAAGTLLSNGSWTGATGQLQQRVKI